MNNVLINKSTPKGTGVSCALRRSSATLTNFGTSNNNLFYCGTPSATTPIYYDGITPQATLVNYTTLVAPRDNLSVTEDPPFLSIIGSNINYLKIDPIIPNLIESRGANIAGYTDDFENEVRQGNAGYSGTGTAPDIGADEFESQPLPIEVTGTIDGLGSIRYPTLKAGFDYINNGRHRGTVTVRVLGNTTETATAVLLASAAPSNFSSVLIYPDAAGHVISGNLIGTSVVRLNGADNVTFDGRPNQTGSLADLTIQNLSTSNLSGTATISLEVDATNNHITYCNILGSSTTPMTTSGGNIWIGDLAISAGNDNNEIAYCNIGPAGTNLPTKCIHFSGSLLNNDHCTIDHNNIYDYFSPTANSSGIYVSNGTTESSFTNNRFYQSATRTTTANSPLHSGIWISNSSGNKFTISGNIIGYANSLGTGTYSIVGNMPSTQFLPIYLSVGSADTTKVLSNTIAGIDISGSCEGGAGTPVFAGIFINDGLVSAGGKPGDATGNTIGDLTTTGSITYTSDAGNVSTIAGIYGIGSHNFMSNNNLIGGITVNNPNGAITLAGLRGGTGSANWECRNNTIGGNTANSIYNTSDSPTSWNDGIYNSSYAGTFSNNIIRNITSAGGASAGTYSVVGIVNTSSVNNTISQNTISNLTNVNGTTSVDVIGISSIGSGANTVERNFIHSLSNASNNTAAEIDGIYISAGTTSYYNNIISLGAATSGARMSGIYDNGGANTLLHNTVSLTGTGSAGVQDAALYSTNTSACDIRDNIFYNARTGSPAHYAYNTSVTGPVMDYNTYFGLQNGAAAGANSQSIDPLFPNAAGTTAPDLIPAALLIGTPIAWIPSDYLGVTRVNPPLTAHWKMKKLSLHPSPRRQYVPEAH